MNNVYYITQCIFFVTFNFVLLQCYSSGNLDYNQKSQPIGIIYPKCFNTDLSSGIEVHKENFNPIHGYAITTFKTGNDSRNHFRLRNVHEKIMII